jgi:hypothetical protein
MGLIDRLVAEWPVISSAPFTHWLVLLAILIAAAGFAHLWNRREMSALNAESRLKDARLTELRTENERLGSEVTKKGERSQPIPVQYGSDTVKTAFLEIRKPDRSVTFFGAPADWSKRDISRFAAFTRLQEAGLAKIEQMTLPRRSVVSGTSAAFDYAETPLPLRAATKNKDPGE